MRGGSFWSGQQSFRECTMTYMYLGRHDIIPEDIQDIKKHGLFSITVDDILESRIEPIGYPLVRLVTGS